MQNCTTILGIIDMRQRGISYDDCRSRYHIGCSTISLIMSRFHACGKELDTLKQMSAEEVEYLFFPPENLRRKDDSVMPDYQMVYDRLTAPGSKANLFYALCICALRQFKTARYIKASQLINELSKAEKLDNYQEELSIYARYDLLVVDDFGLMSMDVNKCRNLFEVFDSRDPHKSILVISQFPVSSWYDMFQDHTYAEACLARLLSGAYRLEMNGKNMRNMEPINKQ